MAPGGGKEQAGGDEKERNDLKENIITTLHQALLRSDVGLNSGCGLCWVNKLNILGINGFPLLSRWSLLSVGFREQRTKCLYIQRRLQHGSKSAFTGGPPWGGAAQYSLRSVITVGCRVSCVDSFGIGFELTSSGLGVSCDWGEYCCVWRSDRLNPQPRPARAPARANRPRRVHLARSC